MSDVGVLVVLVVVGIVEHDVLVVHDVVTVQLEKLHVVTVLQAMTLQVVTTPQAEPPQAGAQSSLLLEFGSEVPPWPKGSLPQFTSAVAAPTAVKLKRIARRSVFIGCRSPLQDPYSKASCAGYMSAVSADVFVPSHLW